MNYNNSKNNLAIIITILTISLIGGYFLNIETKRINTIKLPNNNTVSLGQENTSSTQSEIDNLKKEIESLKNQKQQTIIKETSDDVPVFEPDLAMIINQWRLSIAYIECNWPYINAQGYFTKSGSGLFWNAGKDSYFVLSNLHVVTEDTAGLPKYCTIQIPDDNDVATVPGKDIYKVSNDEQAPIDASLVTIKNPTLYMTHSPITDWPRMGCLGIKNNASVGDQVVILGYPGIGSQTDITATEGIVSGFESDYYITSAKVERGNSGGAAILVKNNCYLGIPTFVEVGQVESLARILDILTILLAMRG